MKIKRRWSAAGGVIASVVALVAATVIATAAPAAAATNEVLNWNKIAVETLVAFPAGGGGSTPGVGDQRGDDPGRRLRRRQRHRASA